MADDVALARHATPPRGLPLVADDLPALTIDTLLRGAEPLGTTRGVDYLRVTVVLARDAATAQAGIYATDAQWPATTAALLIEREQEIASMAQQLAEERARGAAQAAERARLRAARHAGPRAPAPERARPRATLTCPVPGCGAQRETGQALGRHCAQAHGATLNDLRQRYGASAPPAAPTAPTVPTVSTPVAATPAPPAAPTASACPRGADPAGAT